MFSKYFTVDKFLALLVLNKLCKSMHETKWEVWENIKIRLSQEKCKDKSEVNHSGIMFLN